MSAASTPVYFTKLELENIRSFGEPQCLDLIDSNGKPARWTLILGDNGVGKTTLLQCLTRMRPRFNKAPDNKDPDLDQRQNSNEIEPDLAREDNPVLKGLLRSGSIGTAKICAELLVGATLVGPDEQEAYRIMTKTEIEPSKNGNSDDGIEDVKFQVECLGEPVEPLILAYGAGRHMGVRNLDLSTAPSSTDSLFDTAAELFDAEEMLYRLDYGEHKNRTVAINLLQNLKSLLVEILPALEGPDDIDIRGHRLPGSKNDDGGVWVNTSSGFVQFTQLSLGYQTVAAWTADVAWRMLNHFPNSQNPLREPAIVIVDEIDLHLHPQWQRAIRKHLVQHFPAVQFIVTAHSPLMAQDALGANLAVVHDKSGEALITSNPVVVRTWRLDKILTSELFGIESARPAEVAESMKRRIFLTSKKDRTEAEEDELAALEDLVGNMQTTEWGEDLAALEIVRKAAALLGDGPVNQ